MASFFRELKRRNIYKVAVAYAVPAWLLVHAASIIFPTFDAPARTMRVLIAILTVNFSVAVVLAWAFEIMTEGIVRTGRRRDISRFDYVARCGWVGAAN